MIAALAFWAAWIALVIVQLARGSAVLWAASWFFIALMLFGSYAAGREHRQRAEETDPGIRDEPSGFADPVHDGEARYRRWACFWCPGLMLVTAALFLIDRPRAICRTE